MLAAHQVVFVEQQKVVDELRERGLRLDLTLDERRKTKEASVINPPAFVIVASLDEALRYGPFDLALFALKSFDTQSALEGMKPFADKLPPLLCLSNGVSNEPAIAEALGQEKVIYGTVTTAIGRRGAGDIVLEKLRGVGVAKGHVLSSFFIFSITPVVEMPSIYGRLKVTFAISEPTIPSFFQSPPLTRTSGWREEMRFKGSNSSKIVI